MTTCCKARGPTSVIEVGCAASDRGWPIASAFLAPSAGTAAESAAGLDSRRASPKTMRVRPGRAVSMILCSLRAMAVGKYGGKTGSVLQYAGERVLGAVSSVGD